MAESLFTRAGCLRTGLIVVLVIVSVSMAGLYWFYNSGLYEGKELSDNYLFIKNGRIFIGQSDSVIYGNVLVKDGEILCVGDCKMPEEVEVLDAKGKAIIPGLTDMMVQFYAPSGENRKLSGVEQLLSFTQQRPEVRKNFHLAGLTNIRSVGDALGNIITLRKQINDRQLAGPRIFCTGLMFTATGGFPLASLYQGNEFMIKEGIRTADDVNTARPKIREVIEAGVDGIKIVYHDFGGKFNRISQDVLKELVQTAKNANKWVSVHTGTPQEIVEAVNAGANTLEYGSYQPLDSLAIQAMLDHQIMYIPALVRSESDSQQLAIAKANVQKVWRAGVPIGVGADAQDYLQFGRSLQREMELLVEAGLDPLYVLRSATWLAATYLKKDDLLGAITPDRLADLVIIDGTPWENISDIKNVYTVIQEGRIVVLQEQIVE